MNLLEGTAVLERPLWGPMTNQPAWTTEADLLNGCRAGRREALDELVARHYDRILRVAVAMAGRETASDLAQETFLAAVRAIPNFRGEARLSTWLISILRNQYLLHLRGHKKWKAAPMEDEARRLPAPEPDAVEKDVRDVMERVKELPEDLRTTLVLFYVEGLRYAEIAQAMECPIGTVRSRLFDARGRLKKKVEKSS